MYNDPHQVITKVCGHCGRQFDSPRYYNKEYCSSACRRHAKNARETERNRELRPQLVRDAQFFLEVHNPKPKQLEEYSKLILLDMTQGKPIKLTGTVPLWTPPTGVQIVYQQKLEENEPDVWVMDSHTPIDLTKADQIIVK